MINKVHGFLTACALVGATLLPVFAQNDTTMQSGTIMQRSTMMGDPPRSSTMSSGIVAEMTAGGQILQVAMPSMMDESIRAYIAADAAGRAAILSPMTLRQSIL